MRHRIVTYGGLLMASALLATVAGAPAASANPTTPMPATEKLVVVSGDEVMIRTPRPGGGLIINLYRAPEQSSGLQMLARLKAKGLVPAGVTTQVEADPMECTTIYAQAKYLCLKTVPHYWFNWRWNGFSDPQIYFRDHTPAAWPVRASVTEWNRAVGVDSYWTTGACPTGGRHCVHVWNADYGDDWVGHTYMEVDSIGFFIDGLVWVELNDRFSSAEDNRSTACHELGHALGLAHNGSVSSCMYWQAIAGPDPRLPLQTDYQVLTNILYRD
ncbi:matrixin family metalloprotease [Phytohabitans rumicis]|nr:matrixin family metalloprotease [Phytohabitans rumicis]